jgi:O-antigen/teichoic acid export membrane protein
MRAYFREIAWVAVAQAAVFVGGLATVKTAALVLGPAEYGRLSVGLAIIGIFQVCLYGAISQTATRFLVFARTHNLLREYGRSLGKLAAVASIIIALFGIFTSILGRQSVLPLSAAILSGYAILNGIQMIAIAACNAARKRRLVAIVQCIETLTRPLLILAIAHLAKSSASYALLAYIVTTILVLVVIATMSSITDWSATDWGPVQDDVVITESQVSWSMITYAAPFVAFGLLGALGSHGERLLLARWANWSDVGSYALMAQLVMAPNVLFTAIINQFYFPLVFQFDPHGTRRIVRSFRLYLLFSVLGIAAITAVTAVSGSFLIPMFSSRAFLGHEHLLWFLGLSAGLFCVAQQLVLPGLRLNKPAVYMPAKLIHSLTLLGTSMILVPAWGVEGMGIASLLSSVAYLSATMLANVWLDRSANQTELAERYQ